MKYFASLLLVTSVFLFAIGGVANSASADSNMYKTAEVRVGM
ncbi:hypothetical protein P9C27_10600 [Bacillus vallismortis]|nr:hypothetical protein [Bacillus vallismortis]MEC1268983.1 hypothetical protein [Bacillus vallismortis]